MVEIHNAQIEVDIQKTSALLKNISELETKLNNDYSKIADIGHSIPAKR